MVYGVDGTQAKGKAKFNGSSSPSRVCSNGLLRSLVQGKDDLILLSHVLIDTQTQLLDFWIASFYTPSPPGDYWALNLQKVFYFIFNEQAAEGGAVQGIDCKEWEWDSKRSGEERRKD